MKAKYFRYSPPGFATGGNRDSFLWRSLLAGKNLVEDKYVWRVGDGCSIEIWRDKWLSKSPPCAAMAPRNVSPIPIKVCELIDNHSRTWRFDVIDQYFNEEDRVYNGNVHLALNPCPDKRIWSDSEQGIMSVKFAYWVVINNYAVGQYDDAFHQVWTVIWSVNLTPKVRVFCWKLLHGFLLVMTVLQRKCLMVTTSCCVCGESNESISHVFFMCPLSSAVWFFAGLVFNWNGEVENNLLHMFCAWLSYGTSIGKMEQILYLCWMLWFNRN